MADGTKISWADATWSPLVGCTKVSAGCDNCYAIRTARRMTANPNPRVSQAYAGTEAGGEWTGKVNLLSDRLDQPLKWRRPRRIFVNAQSDLFHEAVPDDFIARVWQAMGAAPHHTYQVLTKRHGRMRSWLTRWYAGDIPEPEAWAPVRGFPGYTISTTGKVRGRRADTAGGMAAEAGEKGHMRVKLYREGSKRGGESVLVHRAVLDAFARPGKPGEQARHLNGDARDNRLSNLRWGTQEQNWSDRIRHGNGQSWSKLTPDQVETIRERFSRGESAYAIARDFPVSDTQVRNIVAGRQWVSAEPPRRHAPNERVVLDCVWLGVSVEDQRWADIRVPALLDTPAAVRFLSCEPLLGPVDLSRYLAVGSVQLGKNLAGQIALDDEQAVERTEHCLHVADAGDLPGADRLPAVPDRAVAVPADASTPHGHREPVDQLDGSAVDRHHGRVLPVRPAAPLDVSLSIEKPCDIAKSGRIGGHVDASRAEPLASSTYGASGDHAPSNGLAGDIEALGDLSDGEPGHVGADEVSGGHPSVSHNLKHTRTPGIYWIICGGESGPNARPMHPTWARSLRDQCQAAGVPFHFKQWGEWAPSNVYPNRGHLTDAHCVMHPAGMTAMTKSNPFNPFERGHPNWGQPMRRVGKARAGRELDGRVWDEYPA